MEPMFRGKKAKAKDSQKLIMKKLQKTNLHILFKVLIIP